MKVIEDTEEILKRNVALLSEKSEQEKSMLPCGSGTFPSVPTLKDLIFLIRGLLFPEFFDRRRESDDARKYYIGNGIERLYFILRREIGIGLCYGCSSTDGDVQTLAARMALDFIETLPEIKRLLYTDVQAVFENDPAVDNYGEIILCYPVIQAMINYRVAHSLLKIGVPVIPRILTELAHSATGIDIHPGAQIGEYFAIDHGTGVVIGETCIIGRHVTLYQGVTLGAKNFTYNEHGHPINVPRHPIIEDNVTIYSNSSILGRITVGRDCVIGGNVWLTYSVPPGSRIVQSDIKKEPK